MSTYLTKAEYKDLTEVPDPYFGGSEGFEKVRCLDLLARCGCMQQQAVTQCVAHGFHLNISPEGRR